MAAGDDFLVICDERGTITEISQAAMAVIGPDVDELIGSAIATFGVAHGTDPVPKALRIRTTDGWEAELEVRTFAVTSGGRPRFAVVPALPISPDRRMQFSGDRQPAAVVGETAWLGMSADKELLLSRRLVRRVETALAQASLGIHDGVAQSMSNAVQMLQVAVASPNLDADDQDRITRVLALLREGVSEARSISRDLLPASLDRLGLEKTLNYELENLERVNVRSSFTFDVAEALPKHIVVALYRIAAEILLNVKKHAHASSVVLRVTADARTVSMTASDDGVGLVEGEDERTEQRGLGIMSMHARCSLMGGTFGVVSAPGRGTVILVVLPLNVPADPQVTPATTEPSWV